MLGIDISGIGKVSGLGSGGASVCIDEDTIGGGVGTGAGGGGVIDLTGDLGVLGGLGGSSIVCELADTIGRGGLKGSMLSGRPEWTRLRLWFASTSGSALGEPRDGLSMSSILSGLVAGSGVDGFDGWVFGDGGGEYWMPVSV